MTLRQGISAAVLATLATTAGVEGWCWRDAQRSAQRILAGLAQEKAERDRLMRQFPAPTGDAEEAVHNQLEAARRDLDGLRADLELAGDSETAGRRSKPVDAYFEIAAFVERTRAEAAEAGVAVKTGERFGFAAYASEGPPSDLILVVDRQRAGVQRLLEPLWQSRPRALLVVQRERPVTAVEQAPRDSSREPEASGRVAARRRGASPVAEDFFDFDRNLSIRKAGVVETDAFRLEFTGRTSNLRVLLNRLAESRPPVVVRSIEVEPDETGTTAAGPADGASNALVPLVSANLSRFTVIVEMLASARQGGRSAP